jgi:membrane-bound metal-dependent hydrolase YbcI (DUF457 family)
MFIGHFGLSFAAKKAAPKVSLATLFVATQFVDILWPLLFIFNVETVAITPGYTKSNAFEFIHYPYTHSLFMGLMWGIIVGFLYYLIKKDKRGSIVIGLCVLSHWFFDVIVHAADLPISPFGNSKVGFGLWNYVAASFILETVIFFSGSFIYTSMTKAINKKGSWGLWSLVTLLILISLSNTFGPAPKQADVTLFASLLVLMAIIIIGAWWIDKNRELKNSYKTN